MKINSQKVSIKITSASWHRNGVCGVGFWAITFDDAENGKMVASLFDEAGYCAVYKLEPLCASNIQFGQNSWRGDWYEDELRRLLPKWVKKNDSNRFGPFSMPVVK